MIQLELLTHHPPRVLTKPAEGAPCNGCGQCCSEEVCPIGEEVLGEGVQPPCPFLKWHTARFWCELLVGEAHLHAIGAVPDRVLAQAIGAGVGCTSPDPAGIQIPATVVPPTRRPHRQGVIERGVHATTTVRRWALSVEAD
jgi:hypothetical protein